MNEKVYKDIKNGLLDIESSIQMIKLEMNKKTVSKLEIIQEIALSIASNSGNIIEICRIKEGV